MNKKEVIAVSSAFMSEGATYPHRLVLCEVTSKYTQEVTKCVFVERDFRNNNVWDGIPSGWNLEDVLYSDTLCIDFGQNWFIHPTKEAWDEII